MNWFTRVTEFLGVFWTEICASVKFVAGIKTVLSMFFGKLEGGYVNWRLGTVVAPGYPAQDGFPCRVTISAESVKPAYVPFADVMASGSSLAFDSQDPGYGYISRPVSPVGRISILVDHVVDPSVVLVAGLDFQIRDNGRMLWFRSDIREMPNIPVYTEMTDTGRPAEYYSLIGVPCTDAYRNDAVSSFFSGMLNSVAEDAWRVHVSGATIYNTKKLLGAVTNCVVCEEDGLVSTDSPWQEQGYLYVSVDDRIYGSRIQYPDGDFSACRVSANSGVRKGDVIFGDMKVYSSTDVPDASEVPGILVNTDAGAMWAANSDLPAIAAGDGKYILPLTSPVGDDAKTLEYRERCIALMSDDRVPYVDIPDVVNPYLFIMGCLRQRRSALILLSSDTLPEVDSAIDLVRMNTPVDAMVTVFVRASDESVGASVTGFVSDAGMLGVAECVSVKLALDSMEASAIL